MGLRSGPRRAALAGRRYAGAAIRQCAYRPSGLAVTTAHVVRGIAYYTLLAVLLYLLVRAPKNLALRAIVILIASWALSYPFSLAAAGGSSFLGFDPMVCELISSLLT